MNIRYILTAAIVLSFSITSCKKEATKVETSTEVSIAKMETVSLDISGMTCEIGCAKTIQSKLSRKEGVASAKVVFTDSIATIQFDSNKISSNDLISFIDGIAGGDLYKATESKK
tara:strand:+ start:54607 stop:54951 length:345 start_codon:yes stop_codon:yes gene_type:complete